ncbi:NIPSNAP family protein [Saccharopolyspora phatthalungensis]|uniref:NIPSNAP domain-containing protein n=1 Tax=Saccharopolyspora phatthalungensis TaxID=664693 RepID=A0A840QJ07_9PSEU|nr:NIPSNAP family protein [Saccharopolyspora phatthalungensis]MBB5158958.1 hypothetical protein [Saccharopolyspora phatthalungensis]
MKYELATLDLQQIWDVPKALPRLEAYTAASSGVLLGCWETDIGEIGGRLLVLRSFEHDDDLLAERRRVLTSPDPFGIGEHLRGFAVSSYEAFPFLPPVESGEFGSVYEFRTYELKIGGLTPTMEGWRDAVPARTEMYPLTVAMYALDGVPRITHIWPFRDLNDRLAIRRESYRKGIWPPKGGPENIARATSTIAIPTPFSPLH